MKDDCLGKAIRWLRENEPEKFREVYRSLNSSQKRYIRLIEEGKRSGRKLEENEESWFYDVLQKWNIGGTQWDDYDGVRGRFDDMGMARAKAQEFEDATGFLAYIHAYRDPKTGDCVYEVKVWIDSV